MSLQTWQELQEALLMVFGPFYFWWLVVIVAGGVLSAIGAVLLTAVSHMSR